MIFVKTNFGLYTICMLLMLLMPLALIAQSAHHSLRQGDERYDKAKYAESEKYYAEALKKEENNKFPRFDGSFAARKPLLMLPSILLTLALVMGSNAHRLKTRLTLGTP